MATRMKSNQNQKTQFLLVTTAHKGVFAGYGVKSESKIIELSKARMCVYWSAEVKGVLGLASSGPTSNCKVGPAVSSILLQDVTAVIDVSPEAEKAWETIVWK